MRITATVHDEEKQTYKSTKGVQVNSRVLVLLDCSAEGGKLKQFIEWNAPDEFKPEFGKATGQRITLDISEVVNIFRGRVRVRGDVVAASK